MEANTWTPGQTLISVVDRPRQAFAQIVSRPGRGWFLPVLILLLGLATLNLALAPHAAVEARKQLESQLASLPPAQANALTERMGTFSSPLFVGAMGFAMGILGTVVAILLGAAILYFIGLVVGGEGEFGPTLAATLWAWIPFGLRPLVQAAVIAAQGRPIVNQGLAYLVSVGDPIKDAQNMLYGLLAQVDLFGLWHLVLVFAAALALQKAGRDKALLVTLLYGAISLGLRVGVVLVQRLFMPAL